jgi:hypothetical protein
VTGQKREEIDRSSNGGRLKKTPFVTYIGDLNRSLGIFENVMVFVR